MTRSNRLLRRRDACSTHERRRTPRSAKLLVLRFLPYLHAGVRGIHHDRSFQSHARYCRISDGCVARRVEGRSRPGDVLHLGHLHLCRLRRERHELGDLSGRYGQRAHDHVHRSGIDQPEHSHRYQLRELSDVLQRQRQHQRFRHFHSHHYANRPVCRKRQLFGDFSGTFSASNSGGGVVDFTVNTTTINGVEYTTTTCEPLKLVPPASNNGITTVQGQITALEPG